MAIRCIKAFRDLKAKGRPMRRVGDVWEGDASRAAEINRAGYGVMAEYFEEAKRDWAAMTRVQLLAEAESEGIEVPTKATKAEIARLLGME